MSENCKKKVIDNPGGYECHTCGKVFESFNPYMIGNFKFGDSTDSEFFFVFGEEACWTIFEMDEWSLYDFQEKNEDEFLNFVNTKKY